MYIYKRYKNRYRIGRKIENRQKSDSDTVVQRNCAQVSKHYCESHAKNVVFIMCLSRLCINNAYTTEIYYSVNNRSSKFSRKLL